MKAKTCYTLLFLGMFTWLSAQSEKMSKTENPKTYTTKKSQQKPVQRSFEGSKKSGEKVYISKKKFNSFPEEKQKSILEHKQKYIITEE